MAADGDTGGEIDLRSYGQRIVARWWVVAICVVVAAVASFAITTTSNKNLTQGVATVYLGQPVGPSGALVPNPLSSNPLYATALARQADYQAAAAKAAGLPDDALAGRVSVALISTAVGVKGTAVPLAEITVQGPFTPRQSAAAANAMAKLVVDKSNTYVAAKRSAVVASRDEIAKRLDAVRADADDVRGQLEKLVAQNLGVAERASLSAPLLGILQSNASTESLLQSQLSDQQETLDYIDNVEGASVVMPARGTKVAPASKQFSLLIAIVLGLLVGIIAAIVSTAIWPVRPAIAPAPDA